MPQWVTMILWAGDSNFWGLMKKVLIEYSEKEIWEAWNKIVEYATTNIVDDYPDGSVVLIKKVLESLLKEKNG